MAGHVGVGGSAGWGSMASTPDRDDDSGNGSDSHVIRHIDRNVLSCQICLHRYKDPKVRALLSITFQWVREICRGDSIIATIFY